MNLATDPAADVTWSSSPMAPRTSVEEVLSRLKAMVHVGELGPGDRLPPERLLCEMFQVSRSTLREGLRALRTEGYIEVRRGSSGGSFISPLNEPYARWLRTMSENPSRLREIIDVRKAVECEVARIAAERRTRATLAALHAVTAKDPATLSAREFRDADAQFHLLLAEASNSPRLQSLVAEARAELFAPASSPLIHERTMIRSTREHKAILDAVRTADPDRASALMRDHLQSTYDDVRAALSADATSAPSAHP